MLFMRKNRGTTRKRTKIHTLINAHTMGYLIYFDNVLYKPKVAIESKSAMSISIKYAA